MKNLNSGKMVLLTLFFASTVSCTQGSLNVKPFMSPPPHTLPDNAAPPAIEPPITSPENSTDPELASKAVLEEISNIQSMANSEPDLALSADDLTFLEEEALIDSQDEMKGWVE